MPPRRAQPRGARARRLTAEQQAELRRAAHVQAARLSLIDFVRLLYPGYQAGWFHFELCAELERFSAAVAAGESPRLVLSVPPRHGKSLIVSRIWPVWHMARHPRSEFVCASYAAELAEEHSREAREYSHSEEAVEVFPQLEPGEPDRARPQRRKFLSDRIDKWQLPNGSQYYAVGVGGSLTGKGATILSIDDPVKDRAEAESPTKRRRMHAWYQSTARTRLLPGAGVIITATRWHESDLIGFVLSRPTANQWRVINYPALAIEDEPHRRAGEALHPERYSERDLAETRDDVGEYEWAALYQGQPVPAGGALFKAEWFEHVYEGDPRRIVHTLDEVVISYDCASKKGDHNDETARVVMGRKGAIWYLLDVRADRMDFTELERDFRRTCADWPTARLKLVEDASNGTALIQSVRATIPGVVGVSPSALGSKEVRARQTTPTWQAGQVLLPSPEYVPAIGRFVVQHLSFPAAAHDDMVDAVSQVLNHALAGQDKPGPAERKRSAQAMARAFGG